MDKVHDGFINFGSLPDAAVISASYCLGHGISPGVVSITTVPFSNAYPLDGDVRIRYDGQTRLLRECRLASVSAGQDSGGATTLTFRILDKRWKWKFGWISGDYNLREDFNAPGQREPNLRWSRVSKPRDLAVACLKAMGQAKYNVDQLPNDLFPEIHWQMNPAEALSQLVEQLGCRIVYNPFSDIVKICKLGVGAKLPDGPDVITYGVDVDPPELPESITFLAGRTLYQIDAALEAVGEEADGTILPIDKLSYMPAGGWHKDTPPEWLDVAKVHRDLAKKCIYRMYRIKVSAGTTFFGIKVTDREQLLPLEDGLVEMVSFSTDQESEKLTKKAIRERGEALVYGDLWEGYDGLTDGSASINTAAGKKFLYEGGFSVDAKKGIVRFSNPVYRITEGSGTSLHGPAAIESTIPKPAILWLRVATGIRNPQSFAWHRYSYTLAPKGKELACKPYTFVKEDVYRWMYYQRDGLQAPKLCDNVKQIEAQAKYYIQQELRNFELTMPDTRTYAGFQFVELDGAIQEVSWNLDSSGQMTTVISRNSEHSNVMMSYQERRQIERLKHQLARQDEMRKGVQ